ncbi:Glucokinase [compost metagenome]
MTLPGEGGHVDLPVGNAREAQLRQHFESQVGHVSAESVLSGGGLLRLYQAICAVDGHSVTLKSPADVTSAALAGDVVALATVEQFSRFLARVAGNNVLTLGGRGGVYIVGGVIPHFVDLFLASGFAESFADKGSMSGYFKDVPVWLVTAEYSGLLGAGVALQQTLA